MIKFELTASYFVEDDGEFNLCVYPSSEEIKDFIASYRIYSNETVGMAEINNFIAEQTPLLFDTFQSMDNVPQEIREKYYL